MGKLDLIAVNLAAKGWFSVGMKVEYRCCECPESDWIWGDLNKTEYWLGESGVEPISGSTYTYATPSTLKNIGEDYKEAINYLARNITETCPTDENPE